MGTDQPDGNSIATRQSVIEFERHAGLAVLSILSVHSLLLIWGAFSHSPTPDEIGSLMAGLRHWETGQFDLYRVNPPLVRLVAAVPVLLHRSVVDQPTDASWTAGWDVAEYEARSGRPEYSMGAAFIERHRDRAFWLFTVARWCCLPFSIVGGLACYWWGRDLYGKSAGLLALSMWCFMPDIIGHGQLMTTDVPGAALGVASSYWFWRWLRVPRWREAVVAGLLLGAAQLTKTTLIVLFGLWPVVYLVWHLSRVARTERSAFRNEIVQLAAILGLAVYVLNFGYGFGGTLRPLGEYRFVSRFLSDATPRNGVYGSGNRFADSYLARFPVPLPTDYILGIDEQKYSFERPEQWSYMRHQWRQEGWWYYYLYAALIRVPLGYWSLLAMALPVALFRRRRFGYSLREQMPVMLTMAGLLLVVSSETDFSRHFRYALPVLPFLFILASQVVRTKLPFGPAFSGLVVFNIAWAIASSLWIYPHSLSYFNELIGGPRQGLLHLAGSNIDWGQDLFYLRHWYDRHPEARPLGLAHSAPWIDPSIIGIDWYTPPRSADHATASPGQLAEIDAGPKPGWYVLSANRIIDRSGRYEYFRLFEPVSWIGYSMRAYHISREEANQVRREVGLPEL